MLDFIFIIVLILAVIRGLQKGLVVALFSIIAFIVGLAAATKLSAIVATYLQKNMDVKGQWLPFISFILVFLLVVVLVNMGGKLVEKTFEMAFLGWANRLGGAIFYMVLYTIIFSIVLFYADRMHLFKQETFDKSSLYPYIKPWGPAVIEALGKVIPIFKDSFHQLENFFQHLSDKIDH